MGVGVSPKARREMQPVWKKVVDRFLTLRPEQRKQIDELAALYRKAKSPREQDEISDVVSEIMFGEPSAYEAVELGSGSTPEGKAALANHRQYVGRQIRKRRQALKMSQEELAAKAGIPQSHVCRLETGKHAPSYMTIEKVAKALKTKPSQLDPGFDD